MDNEEDPGETLPEHGNMSPVKSEQQGDDDSMSGSVRGRRVTDPIPVVRAPPGGQQLDPELISAWQSMGKVKSALRRAEHRLDEADSRYNLMPAAECSVTSTHNPPSTAACENRLPSYRSQEHIDSERGTLVDSHGRTNYMRSRSANTSARKVSRFGDKYMDDVPMRDEVSSVKKASSDYHSRSPKKVEFLSHAADSYKDINPRSSTRSAYLPDPSLSSAYKSLYDHHVVPSVYDMNNLSFNASDLNTTDPRALRETEIRFLNENHGGAGGSAVRGHEGLRRSAGMSRLTQVKVTVPGTTMYSSSSHVGSSGLTYTTSGRTNTVSTTSLFSRPDYSSDMRAHVLSGQNNPPSSFTGVGTSALPAASLPLSSSISSSSSSPAVTPSGGSGSNYKHAYGQADYTPAFDNQTVASRITNNAPITTIANSSTETVNSTSSGFAKVRKLRKSFNESDGFSKLKEKLKQQRMNLTNKVEERAEENDHEPMMGRNAQHHHDNEVVVPKSYALYDKPLPVPKVRKVAAAPPPPSYKGFSEPETRVRPAVEGKVFKLSELMRRKTRRKEASERQDKKKEGQPGSPEETKKVPRVIAKKPSKYDKKDIITTRSWRMGQEAVLRELGPVRVKKIPHSPPTKDTDQVNDSNPDEEEIENKPPKPASSAAEKHTGSKSVSSQSQQGACVVKSHVKDSSHDAAVSKALSSEAKSILADLISDNSDSEDEAMCDKKVPAKRKIIKQSEPERQQPAAKVRHYDSEEVRRYIAKQRADRKRKLLEEKESQRKANESKHRQLQELYKRQKETARVPATHGLSQNIGGASGHFQLQEKTNLDSTFTRDDKDMSAISVDRKVDVDSEKDDSKQWSETSSEASTLTGDSFNQSPDHDAIDDQKKSNKKSKLDLLDTPLNVDDIISKYTKAMAARKESERDLDRATPQHTTSHKPGNTETRSETVEGRYKASSQLPADPTGHALLSSLPPSDLGLASSNRPFTAPVISGASNSSRSRAERIAAITNTAASLRNRLRIETERINKNREIPQKSRGPPLSVDDDRWAFRRSAFDQPAVDASLDYVPRHERLGGAKADYAVFKSNLPGVSNLGDRLVQVEVEKRQEAAATCIQAVYRGHTVRQGLAASTDKIPDNKPKMATTLDETADSEGLSDITLTEDDSDIDTTPKIGSRLREDDYHLEHRRELDNGASTPKGYGGFLSTKSKYSWNDPAGDPYSVINIYTRQYERDRAAQGHMSSGGPKSSTPGQDKDLTSKVQTSGASPPEVHRSVVELSQSESPILSASSYIKEVATEASMVEPSYEDDFTGSSMRTPQRKSATEQKSDKPVRLEELKLQKSYLKSEDDLSNDDDTLEGSYGNSLESDEDRKRQQVVLSTQKSQESLAESDISSLSDDISRRDPKVSSSRGSAKASLPPPPSRGYSVHAGPRLSPAALSQRMTAELNLLEGMEESVRQLTDTERTRAVALSQQETVSLAQILKARQQEHDRSMQALQMKARQESLDASKELENARRRAADAAQNAVDLIAQVRSEGSASLQGSTKKLIESQAEVARATAQAAKQLAQVKNMGFGVHDVTKVATETATAAATAAVTAAMRQAAGLKNYDTHSTQVSQRSELSRVDSRVSKTDASYDSESFDSGSYTPPHQLPAKHQRRGDSKTESIRSSLDQSKRSAVTLRTASVATASDISRRGRVANDSDSSIKTDVDAAAGDASRTESVPDEVSSSVDDYSLTFEATEDELEEQSFREILPSLVHMKKVKKEGSFSDLSAYSSDHEYVPPTHNQSSLAGRVKHEDLNSPFHHGKEDSFTRFTADMVKQYMKEEEIRAQHQAALLQLREKALKEKTKAELAWLEQQKRHLRDKGADDSYPAIRKKKRGVLMRLQQEQAEIKRLQEAHMKEHLDRRKELTYLTQVQKKSKLTKNACEASPADLAAEELHMSDTGENQKNTHKSPVRDNKSDSEVYTENSDRGRTPSPSGERLTKLQKMKLDKKYLTSRERKLRERRKNVEELLAWKKQLDEEEAKVYHMEEQALHVWERENDNATPKSSVPVKPAADKRPKRLEKVFQAEKAAPKTPQDTPRDVNDSIMTDTIVTARDESKTYQSIPEEISSQSRSTVRNQTTQHERSGSESSINDEIKTESRLVSAKDYQRSGSESSLQEQSRSSSAASQVDKSRTHDSSDDTIVNSSVNEEYSNDTFESAEATATATDNKKKPSSTSPAKTNKLSKSLGQGLSPRSLRSPKSPFSPANNRKGSESESEDSFSLTHSETASDQSDNEGRIRALTEELRRRKIEAERLKKEQKRRHKERMKAKEASLKKQIEAYEILISQVKSDLQKELEHEPVKPGIKPQIKQPRVSESKRLKKQEATTTPEAGNKPRSESESSKSSLSSVDEPKDLTASPTSSVNSSSQVSPQSSDSSRHSLSPIRPDTLITTNKRTSLESISESTESPLPSPSKPDNKLNREGATSPLKAQSNISISEVLEESIAEELPDEISVSISEPIAKSGRSLTFKLDEPVNKDSIDEVHDERNKNVDDVSVSEVDDYSYSFSVASRTEDPTTPRAKSINISKHVSHSEDVEQSKKKKVPTATLR